MSHPGFVPPYILEALQSSDDPQLSELGARTLELDHAARAARLMAPAETVAGLPAPARHKIYDAHNLTALPGTLARDEGDPATANAAVDEAYDGIGATRDLYRNVLSRNSLDDAGLELVGSVHYGDGYDNALWNGTQMVFGDGDGSVFNRFTIAIDIVGHELTHGVTQYTAALAYQGQSGALNESVSDVFGSLVKQYAAGETSDRADWLIGAGLFAAEIRADALRSMKAPGTAYDDPRLGGSDPQPATMAGYVSTTADSGGVHVNSGIPNRAFYLAATSFGGHAWEQAGHIWYAALTDPDMPRDASFAQFARLTVQQAGVLYGEDGRQRVDDAWHQVGVKTSTSR